MLLKTNNTTELSEKGNGLQKAGVLALIQPYADSNNRDEQSQFYIDEPEFIYTHLHKIG